MKLILDVRFPVKSDEQAKHLPKQPNLGPL
jgi:hypothetical protein